MMISHQN